MNASRWRAVGWATLLSAAVGFVVSLEGAVRVDRLPPLAPVEVALPTISAVSGGGAEIDSLYLVVAANPFRRDRRSAPVRYATGALPLAPEPPVFVMPNVQLVAIASGPARSVAGLAHNGKSRLVRSGDSIAGLLLVGIEPREVYLSGPDTLIILRLRDPLAAPRRAP